MTITADEFPERPMPARDDPRTVDSDRTVPAPVRGGPPAQEVRSFDFTGAYAPGAVIPGAEDGRPTGPSARTAPT